MTHQYESEILNKLMERDGFNIPSSVPPYEAEIKAYLINQVKQAYPKLTDYEAEWLLYNYTKHLPADFPISSVSNVTKASFENVVPFAYQSAILKGQTLVNVISGEKKDSSGNVDGNGFIDFMINQNLKANTTYTAIFKVETDAEQLMVGITSTMNSWNSDPVPYVNGNNKILLTTTTETTYSLRIRYNDTSTKSLVVTTAMLIEGDYTNEDIHYFEGMQSIKMPVLTTSNGEGTKTNILTVNEEVTLRGIGDVKDELNLLTGELTQRIGEVVLDDSYYVEGSGTDYIIDNDLPTITRIRIEIPNLNIKQNSSFNCATMSSEKTNWGDDREGFQSDTSNGSNRDNWIWVKINKSKLATLNKNGVINYLKDNPITVQYELDKKPIKTVDLKCINQDNEETHFIPIEGTMHVSTSGQPIQPKLDMSVPVEATTQNLSSFINLEMEE